MRRLLAAGAVLATLSLTLAAAPAPAATVGIWLTPGEIAALPMSGPAWDRVKATADGNLGLPDLGDYNSDHDVRTLAVALVYVRTGEALYRRKAADAIMGAIGTEDGGQAVTLGRNLDSYVFAADLIDLASFDAARDAQFRTWLAGVRHEVFSDGSLISNDENRANNHGRVAGGSRVAVAAYLGDAVDLARAAQVFKGWLGDRSSYASFKYGDLSWQADPALPVGINPPGAVKDGHAIGGAMPEEMRRGCSFRWPPCPTGYPWGGLQGALIEAEVLFRSGYDAFAWESQALRRAAQFILDLDQALGGWWATGDDTWQPWFVNFAYGTAFPTRDAAIGKTMGWTDWTHARVRGGGGNTPPSCSDVSLTVAEGTAGEVAPACVDLDLDPLGFGIVGQGSKGVASVVAGQLRYEPAAGETGADSFSYRANDGSADGNVAIVSVTITPAGGGNTPPSCSDVSLTVAEGTAGEVAPACVDLDLDPLGFGIVGQGSKGVASVVAGQLRYEPAAGETGADSFSYRANDGSDDGNVAIVSVTITPAGGGGPVTLLPNGDGTRSAVIRDKNGGTTSLFSSIDDTIATPDNGTTYVRNNNRASGSYFARLTDVPAGFAGMAALTVDVRARTTGRVDDLTTLYAQVFAADEATPLTAEVAVITNPGTSGFVTVSGVVLTGVVAGSEADWDGATLRLRWQHAAVGSADTTQLRLTAVELHGMSF